MTEYEPSKTFVEDTMKRILMYEESQEKARKSDSADLSAGYWWGLAGGGAVLGAVNLLNLFIRIFSPVNCF
jgi:hypothetical protein